MKPVLRIRSQIHSLIHGTRPGTSAFHSPACESRQRLKPRMEHNSIPFAQRLESVYACMSLQVYESVVGVLMDSHCHHLRHE